MEHQSIAADQTKVDQVKADKEILRQAIRRFGEDHPDRVCRLKQGERFIHQGTIGTDCFLIEEGSVRVLRRPKDSDEETELPVRYQGDLVGEIGLLLRNHPRTASVEVASEEARLIQVSWEDILDMTGEQPDIEGPVLRSMRQLAEVRQQESEDLAEGRLLIQDAFMSALIADIHGFTSLSEVVWEEFSNSFLFEFMVSVEEVVESFAGTFEDQGDGFKALFRDEDYAVRSIECAIKVQKIFYELREKWAKKDNRFRNAGLGIGICSDVMSIRKNPGKPMTKDKVFSHAINLAASITKYQLHVSDVDIYIDSTTARLVKDRGFSIGAPQQRWLEKPASFRKFHHVETEISKQKTLQEVNPYIVGPPITDEKAFFGRRTELSRILGAVINNHFLISGERRIGKTSLLHQVKRHLEKIAESDPIYRLWPIYLTLQGVPEEKFFIKLIGAILQGTNLDGSDLGLVYPTEVYDDFDFEEDLRRIIGHLRAQVCPKQVRLILCVDELDVLVDYPAAFREQLRAVIQEVDPAVRLVAAGVVAVEQESLRTSPFYNQFTRVELNTLSREEVEQLIRQPTAESYDFTDVAVDYIIDKSHGLPSEVQRLCQYAVNEMLESKASRVDLRQAELAFESAIKYHEPGFQQTWWGGQYKNAGLLQPSFSEEQREELRQALEVNGGLIPKRAYEGEDAVFSRRELDNLTYESKDGLRLTSCFTTWMERNVLRGRSAT